MNTITSFTHTHDLDIEIPNNQWLLYKMGLIETVQFLNPYSVFYISVNGSSTADKYLALSSTLMVNIENL